MSHFTVLVITPEKPDAEILARALQPFHEFECTGTDDEYVQSIDRTEEARQHIQESDDKNESAAEVIEGWFGWKAIGSDEQPNLAGDHKYGYVQLNADGTLLQAIGRTNPNKKWDWWVVGGRWKGMLRLAAHVEVRHVEQTGEPFPFHKQQGEPGLMGSSYSSDSALDVCCVGDLDIARMKREAVAHRQERWDDTLKEATKIGFSGTPEELDGLRRAFYRARRDEHARWMAGGEPRDRREHYQTQMPAELLKWDPVFVCFIDPRSTDEDIPVAEWIAAAPALSTFAVLKDGQWYERGKMGWWGCVANEKERDVWDSEYHKLLMSVPKSHWLTVVDCHI